MEDNQNNNNVQNAEQSQGVDTSNISVKENVSGGLTAEVNPIGDPMEDSETPEESKENNEQENAEEDNKPAENLEADITNQKKAEEDLKEDLKNKGVDFDALSSEYNNNGELSEESLKALEKAGYPKTVVDMYLKGLQATTERYIAQVKSYAGGDEGYNQLVSFLKTQSQDTIDEFNESIKSGNLGRVHLVIKGLQAEMTSKYGTTNKTIMGNGGANSNPEGYTSMEQMTKDMSDPRYQVDPKFTREVMRKIKNATIF